MFKIDGNSIISNNSVIYEAPGEIIYGHEHDEGFIFIYDGDGKIEELGWAKGMKLQEDNILKVDTHGNVIWRIRGGKASGFRALYLEDGNYWASGYNEREFRFDPETGELLGWTYP